MKKMICCTMAFLAFNAFASTMVIAPNHAAHKKALKQEISTVDSLVVAQNEENKELVVKGNAEKSIDMKDVASIDFLKGKDPDDKISFFINGEKRTYKLSEIKSIKVRTIDRN